MSTRSRAGVIGGAVLAALVVAVTLLSSKPTSSPGPSGASSSGITARATPTPTPHGTSYGLPTPPPVANLTWHTTEVRSRLTSVAVTPRGILAVGWDDRGGVLWLSADGQDWAIDDDSVVFDGARLDAVTSNKDRTVIVGCLADAHGCLTPTAWVRSNAATASWARASGRPFGTIQPSAVVATPTAFLAAGQDGDGKWHAWTSSDGQAWTAATVPGAGNDRINAFAGYGTQFAALGRQVSAIDADGNPSGPAAMWTSVDGQTWTITNLVQEGSAWAAADLADGSHMVVGGNDTKGAGYVWTSAGTSWTLAYSSPTECGAPLTSIVAGPDGIAALAPCGGVDLTPGHTPTLLANIDPVPLSLVDGTRGYVGVGDDGHSIVTSFFDAANAPLDPLAGLPNGEGWTTPTSLPIANPMTAVADRKGRVLVFSLTGTDGSLRVDRFDPATGRWTRLPDIAAGMSWARAVIERDGSVLLVGVSLSGRAAEALELDPATLTWRWRASPSVARTSLGLAELGGFVYAVGGRVSPCCDGVKGSGALDVVERFDEAHNTWSTVAHMPVADLAPGAIGTRIPVPPDPSATPAPTPSDGSEAPQPMQDALLVFLPTRVWLYDPATHAWTPGPASLSAGVTGSPVVGVDGIIRVFTCTRYDLYDPTMGHWQPGQAFDVNRCGAIAVAVNEQVYVFGGTYLPDPGRSVSAFFAGGG
jgi:Kelch motif